MHCPKCGSIIDDNSESCRFCKVEIAPEGKIVQHSPDGKVTITGRSVPEKINLLKKELGSRILNKFSKPFLPDDNFYLHWDKDNPDSLRLMASRIMDWLDINPRQPIVVAFGDVQSIMDQENVPGFYTEIKGQEIILVDNKYKGDQFACGAILAHELMHYYLAKKQIRLDETHENELLTDLATIYCGLGVLIINGMQYSSSWFWTIFLFTITMGRYLYSKTSQLSFGYFDPNQYGNHFRDYLKENETNENEVIGFILPGARKFFKKSIFTRHQAVKKTKIVEILEKKALWGNIIKVAILAIVIPAALWIMFSVNSTPTTNLPPEQQQRADVLSTEMNSLKKDYDGCINQLNSTKTELDSIESLMDKNSYNESYYNSLVPKQNTLVNQYNAKRDECLNKQNSYNSKVDEYNNLIK